MRDHETIDSELRRIALARQSIREQGRQPSFREIDALLDERLGHPVEASVATAVKPREPHAVAGTWAPRSKTRTPRRRRMGLPRRVGLFAVLPLSLFALVAAVVVMLSFHHQDATEQATETSPSAAPPPKAVAPKAPTTRIGTDIVDATLVATLKQEDVPVPSQEYVTNRGHAVCDFLAHQRNFSEAVGFVQRSSIWDAHQSALVTAGAIISYCPQSQPSAADELQPAYQNTLSDLQGVEGKLKGIEGDLQGIEGSLPGLPGHP